MTHVLTEREPDEELWRLVGQGSVEAFEVVVKRHQSVVASVAYNACGNIALSEDVAQETFWTAWRDRNSLEQPGRLRAWLCGIARNLGKNAWRKASRLAGPLDAGAEPPAESPGPEDRAVSREEEALVWETLGKIPESYREPLILFYREAQSVAEVAAALELSEDAVKQRLSRGRGMLRDRMAAVVEDGLRRSRPGSRFTAGVITGLNVKAVGVKAALGVAKAAAPSAGGLAYLLGPLFGLLGGWLGVWLPAELAHTRRERELLRRSGRRLMALSLAFTALMVVTPLVMVGNLRPAYLYVWGVMFLAFMSSVLVTAVRTSRQAAALRAGAGAGGGDEPNDSALRAGADAVATRLRGRVYRSRTTLLGLPLLDVNVSDPVMSRTKPPGTAAGRTARGWVAIGDDARGVLLAVGARKAVGLVAVGGLAFGALSFGGVAVGLVAVGGCALGVVGVGGLGLGVFAVGGLAVGWQACGGGAVAWDVACGGGAVARHAAFGGGAFALDYAVGGDGWARHFNDDAAKALLLGHPLKRGLDWYAAHVALATTAFVVLVLLAQGLMLPLMYRRVREP